MKTRLSWLTALGLGLYLVMLPLSQGWGGEVEKTKPAPANQEKTGEMPPATQEAPATPEKPTGAEKPAGLVGTIVAVVPESRTLVVDVPLGNDVLRIGAEVTEATKITAAGKATSLDKLAEGARVRIAFRRVDTGDEATSVVVLQGTKG